MQSLQTLQLPQSHSLRQRVTTPFTGSTVLLQTTLLQVVASNGTSDVFQALLDSGSMSALISQLAADLLFTHCRRQSLTISGISETSPRTHGCTDLKLTLWGACGSPSLDKISANHPALNSLQCSPLRSSHTPGWSHFPRGIDILVEGAISPKFVLHKSQSQGQHALFWRPSSAT